MSHGKVLRNKQKIVQLLNENIDLKYNMNLKTFKSIYEENRNIGTKKKPNFKFLKIGIWNEGFKDTDTGEVISVERKSIIEIDGQKSDGWNLLKYYTLKSL